MAKLQEKQAILERARQPREPSKFLRSAPAANCRITPEFRARTPLSFQMSRRPRRTSLKFTTKGMPLMLLANPQDPNPLRRWIRKLIRILFK
jgi:hypothetical protein